MTNKQPVLVLFGIGSDDKPHAAQFDIAHESQVGNAASLMAFQVGRAEATEALELARSLPLGRFFETGKAFVPYVKPDIYDRLRALLKRDPGAAPVGSQDKANKPTDPWASIKVGSVMLALETPGVGGWFESVVLSMGKGDTLTLRWKNYPKIKPFTAKRRDVAILSATH